MKGKAEKKQQNLKEQPRSLRRSPDRGPGIPGDRQRPFGHPTVPRSPTRASKNSYRPVTKTYSKNRSQVSEVQHSPCQQKTRLKKGQIKKIYFAASAACALSAFVRTSGMKDL